MTRNITFVPGVVPPDDEDEVDAILQRLPPAAWGTGDESIRVRKRFTGAGGAMVLQIEVHSGASSFVEVVKIGPAAEMAAERAAYEKVIAPISTRICAPIRRSTVDPSVALPPDRSEAIFYGDVGQFAGAPEATVSTLEEVFTAATLGDRAAADRAAEAIDTLFRAAATSLYNGAAAAHPAQPLGAMIPSLGPDLVLVTERLDDAGGSTVWSGGHPTPGTPRPLFERGVWKAGTRPENAGGLVGTLVTIRELTLRRRDDIVLGRFPHATVRLRGVPPEFAEREGSFAALGRVESTRPRDVLPRLLAAVPGLSEDGDLIRTLRGAAVHPYAALQRALEVELRPVHNTRVHGDLNARNVLLVGSDPYLIDYARSALADSTKPLLSDFAWLEINLMRAVGGDPSPDDLVRLQRLVTAAAALLPVPGEEPGVDLGPFDRLAPGTPGLASAWAILVRSRWHAYRCYPAGSRDDWLADYGRHLVLAAHRTFKWPDSQQSSTGWAASAATAAVAGEWIGTATPFRHWDGSDLPAVAEVLAAAANRAPYHASRLLGALTREIDRRGVTGLDDTLATAANVVAAAVFRPPPDTGWAPFMELSVTRDGEPSGRPAVNVLTDTDHAVLFGPAGTGKTMVVHEMARRMRAVVANRATIPGPGRHRLPVLVPAAELAEPGVPAEKVVARYAPVRDARCVEDLLRAGCLHLLVDGPTTAGSCLTERITQLRRHFSRLAVLVSRRGVEDLGPDAPVYRLQPPSPDQAVRFLVRSAVRGGVPMAALRDILAGRGSPRIDELFGTAMGVALLARHLRPQVLPSLTDLLDESFVGVDAHPEAALAAERLAAAQIDHDEERTAAATAGRIAPPAVLAFLLEQGVLEQHERGLSFARPVYRDHFAARAAARDTATLAARALRLAWQEPLRLAAARRGAGELTATVLPAVRHTDPVFAARLLAMTTPDDPAFIAEQAAVLRDVAAGRVAQQVAARALRALGEPGVGKLCQVARDDRCPPTVRRIAVQPLLEGDPSTSPQPVQLAAWLLDDRPQPASLREAAVELAARHRATHLAALIAVRCDAKEPWGYHRATHNALRRLGVAIPGRVDREYRAAARRRLDRLTAVLPRLTRRAVHTAAQRERVLLLQSPLREDRQVLLAHRFDYEIGEYAVDLLAALPDGSAGGRPSVAGEPPHPAAAVESLLALNHRDDRQNEQLASLLTTVWAMDRVRGAHLAERVHTTLASSGSPDRLRWPISAALARCSPDPVTVEALLLSADDADRALAVAALSSAGFHLDAAPPPDRTLSRPARDVLRSLRPPAVAGWAAVEYVRAAATADLAEGLELADELLALRELGDLVRLVPHPVHGVLTLTARSEVLSAAGFLASRYGTGSATAERIRTMDLTGAHPSDVTGRLVALAYLGDTATVLDRLNGAEPRLHAAARHAVTNWSRTWGAPDRARDAVAALLRDGHHDARARSTLWELFHTLVERTGRLTAPGG